MKKKHGAAKHAEELQSPAGKRRASLQSRPTAREAVSESMEFLANHCARINARCMICVAMPDEKANTTNHFQNAIYLSKEVRGDFNSDVLYQAAYELSYSTDARVDYSVSPSASFEVSKFSRSADSYITVPSAVAREIVESSTSDAPRQRLLAKLQSAECALSAPACNPMAEITSQAQRAHTDTNADMMREMEQLILEGLCP